MVLAEIFDLVTELSQLETSRSADRYEMIPALTE